MFEKIKNIHFVGIGGAGMCGIAEVLLNMGYSVSGSDMNSGTNTERLKSLGAVIYLGHAKENLKDPHVVVISSAINQDNEEVVAARYMKIPVIRRAEMLAELLRLKYALCIAGTHGKTTTTSMMGLIMSYASMDPTVVIGGLFRNLGSNVKLGDGDFMVVEADESDGSFLHYTPTISIVTNIDDDHMEYYGGMDNLKKTFIAFLNKIPFYGFSTIFGDDINLKSILGELNTPYCTYGLSADNDYSAISISLSSGRSDYELVKKGKRLGHIEIFCSGMHNVTNSLAAAATALEIGIDFKTIQEALSEYKGVGRRLENTADFGDLMIYDDYAHHPTAMSLSINSLKKIYPDRKLIVAFQPHRYTRTKDLYKEFSRSLELADYVYITDIYSAGEKVIEGISSKLISDEFRDKSKIAYFEDFESLAEDMKSRFNGKCIFLTLGAGNIYLVGEKLMRLLNEDNIKLPSGK